MKKKKIKFHNFVSVSVTYFFDKKKSCFDLIHFFLRVAYVSRCQNRNLDEYMSDCWTDETIANNIISIRDESPLEPDNIENEEVIGVSAGGDSPIINNVRVPIQYHYLPIVRPFPHVVYPSPLVMTSPYGYIYQHNYQ